MASSGLRKRGAGGGTASATTPLGANGDGNPFDKSNAGGSTEGGALANSYTAEDGDHLVAYDPRDISESKERSKQPKLTLMEEVLLLGLKDKQVRKGVPEHAYRNSRFWLSHRKIRLSGIGA